MGAPSVCGNTIVEGDEDCDDGNTAPGDCCSALCAFEAPGSSCVDANACTSPDSCDGSGICSSGSPLDCHDGDPCTADSCDEISGCANAPIPECTVTIPSSAAGTRVALGLVLLATAAAFLRKR